MNKATKLLCCSLVVMMTAGTAAAQWGASVARSFYENARYGNKGAILRLKRNGYSINSTDEEGNTALCLAIQANNFAAYDLLKKNGADVNHECTKKFEQEKKLTYYKGFVWKPRYTLGAVAVVGGIAALAAGGGGGGGSSHGGGSGNGGNGGGDNGGGGIADGGSVTDNDIVTYLDPSDFESEEYKKGNFLADINASTAYSRLYGLDADGNLATKLESVKVGVIDSGVDSDNSDFAVTAIEGFNQDYGPCRNGNTTNCWSHSGNTATLKAVDSNGDVTTYTVSISAESYNSWAADYSDSYVWSLDSENTYQPEELRYDGDGNILNPGTAHGTHVAGIIAADKNGQGMHGVAFSNAELIAGRWDFMTPAANPISTMVDRGAQVINMSFGVEASDELNATHAQQEKNYLSTAVLSGIDKAAEKNVVLVMSAGNEGYSQPGLYNGIPLLTDYTDKLKNLFITVVATNSEGKIASYSNRCGASAAYCIAAPGGDGTGDAGDKPIWSTGTSGEDILGMFGTSMAAPTVAGSVALLMGAYPYLEPQEVVELIFETANDEGIYADSAVYGHGMLDLAEATNPQGYLGTFDGDNVDGNMVNIASTVVRVPAVFKQALVKNMPKTVTVFDKYNRPFALRFSSLVATTHSGEKKFRNDLYNFSRRQPKQTVAADGFSFGFAPSSYSNSDGGMGIVDLAYENDNHKTSFFFAENSEYASGSYQDTAMFNPYLAMNEAYGVENSMKFDNLGLKFGFMTGENGLYDGDSRYHDYDFDNRAYAFNSEVSYQMTPQFNLTAVSGVLSEDDAVLGLNGRGALGVGDSDTFYAGLMLGWQPSEKWSFGGAYYHGWTDSSASSGSMMRTSRLMSNSFALDGHYNMNKTDVIGLQLSSPLRIYSGHADFDIATGRDNFSSTVYRENVRANLKPSAREYKFALYHNRELGEDIMFRSEFAVRLNPEHESGAETDYRGMVGLSWAF